VTANASSNFNTDGKLDLALAISVSSFN